MSLANKDFYVAQADINGDLVLTKITPTIGKVLGIDGSYNLTLIDAASSGGGFNIFKETTEARSSTTTLADDAELFFEDVPAGDYLFKFNVIFSVSSDPDPSGIKVDIGGGTVGVALVGGGINAFPVTNPATTGTDLVIAAEGTLTVASPGTVAIQWAQNSSFATDTTVNAGSTFQLFPV